MVNPIANNEETGCDELKDSHILYRNDLNRIEVWYLGRVSQKLGGDGKALTLFRKYSYDGIKWSDYEIMDTVAYLSPTVIWNGSKYQMWSIGFETYGTEGTFVYQESSDGINWTEPEKCSINNYEDGLKLWHGAVTYDVEKEQYIFTYIPTSTDSQTIEVCLSKDGVHFDSNKSIVKNGKDTMWQRLYRPCILIENGIYHLFYGVITEDNKWYISYSSGNDLDTLKGITERDIPKMNTLNSTVINTNAVTYKIKKIYHAFCDFFRPEIIICLVVLFSLYNMMSKKKMNSLQCLLCVVVCWGYTFLRLRPHGVINVISVFGIGLFEAVCTFGIISMITQNIFERMKRDKN